ncbi:MAG: ATP phosphoribosyltransferase [Peptococcaceae bacterium]|jgi:ATP phosphoribosyltransferase|nr:ATP phosphoribosyltransferase [Peptococcaceae bacterium]
MEALTIALTKGRLQNDAVNVFKQAGLPCDCLTQASGRKLVLEDPGGDIRYVLAKAPDVVTYVEHGAADLGVVGLDTLMEHGGQVYEILDLGIGRCRFVVAGFPDTSLEPGPKQKRIATKYPAVAGRYFKEKGLNVNIIRIEGSVELAPLLGLSDAILDIAETGGTLRDNGLVVLEGVAELSARLIVNIASMKLKQKEIRRLVERLWGGERP